MSNNPLISSDFDSVFPGENWFYYWKTSASLWRDKLNELPGNGRVLVPINWAFHSENGEQFDFAFSKPETDLGKLAEIGNELGRKIVFLLPLTPAPFLPNGGVPPLLARNPSYSEDGLLQSAIGPDGKIAKLYSFFDTRLFQAYGKFTKALGQFFSERGVDCDLWGIHCGFLNEEGFQSCLVDQGPIYQAGFSKFLSEKKSELAAESEGREVLTPEMESELHTEFFNAIEDVYLSNAQSSLASNWEGFVKVAFLGGGSEDFFNRINQVDYEVKYSRDILESITQEMFPSSALLPSRIKAGAFGEQLKTLVTDSFSNWKIRNSYYDGDESSMWQPLVFFEVFDSRVNKHCDHGAWADLCLWDYLQNEYQWCFLDKGASDFKFDEAIDHVNRLYFFHGDGMDIKLFHNMLRVFMSGGKVLLNRSGISPLFLKKLESFFLENSLKVEKVNFVTSVHNITLGEGRLVVFEGDVLTALSEEKCEQFWDKLVGTFEILHPVFNIPEDVNVFWRTRGAGHNELQYEDIRRLSLFNPTSYKKKLKLPIRKHFALLKVSDETNVNVVTSGQDIEVEMLPGGIVSFDFGVFQ